MSTIPVASRPGSVADIARLMAAVRHDQPAAARRPAAPSDMMYAWSMNASPRPTTYSVGRVREERCPPEAYLG